jgi:hypothetical protein
MKPLVSGCEAAFKRLSDELSARFNLSRNP